MKIWLKKFQISTALDAKKSSGHEAKMMTTRPDDLGRFEAALQRLDHQLKNARPAEAAPDDLHIAIMRRVRIAARQPETHAARPAFYWRWLAAPGLALLVGLGMWLTAPGKKSNTAASVSSESARSLAVAASTLEITRTVVQNAPATALAPMENEINRLRNDGRRAMEVVLASLPRGLMDE